MSRALVVGLFVGGRGSRMGGVPKGNLKLESGMRLIERLVSVCRTALPDAPIVLVGKSDAYTGFDLPRLDDAPAGIGPLGGLRALLAFARAEGYEGAVALACDMPFVNASWIRRVAREEPGAAALAARERGTWHAFGARYAVRALSAIDAALAAHEHSLQSIFDRLGDEARALDVDGAELAALSDWDTPEDMPS